MVNTSRAEYISKKYGNYLKGKVLDVGCGEAPLRNYVKNYIGIDFSGNPDIVANLEEIKRLPFKDDEFDCVVCTDTLEHLDNLHYIYDELLRVSNNYIIISLPNGTNSFLWHLLTGARIKYYGLPLENMADRHKWFFSYTEAENFIYGNQRKGYGVVECNPTYGRIKLPVKNLFAYKLWAVLQKC